MNAKDFPRLSIPKPPKERGKFPARLHVLLAQDAKVGLVIRRGPSKLVCTVLWNRERNTFKLGQWMRGRIYERRSDLSPDGKHFIYFAMNGKWESETKGAWTAISRVPYLNALALYAKGDCCAILKIPKGFQPSAHTRVSPSRTGEELPWVTVKQTSQL